MNRCPTFSAMAFSMGNFKVTCEVEESLLKLSLSSISSPEPLKLSLSKLVSSDSNIDLVIQALPPSCAFASPPNTKTANEQPIAALHEKLINLQREMKSLEDRISAKGPNQGLNAKHYRIFGRSLKGEMHLHDESEQDSQARMQLLNNVLQEKLLEKEGNIVQLERRLLEREELVRELADKLITANIEKQDIFVQYEKILQNTVFSKLQQPKPEQGEGDPEVVLALEVKEQENQLEAVQ